MNMFDNFIKNMPKDQLRDMVIYHLQATGQRFSVTFRKKSDNKMRTMVASFGVKGKGIKPAKVKDTRNVNVYEALRNAHGQFNNRQIRSFCIDNVVSITAEGRTFDFI